MKAPDVRKHCTVVLFGTVSEARRIQAPRPLHHFIGSRQALKGITPALCPLLTAALGVAPRMIRCALLTLLGQHAVAHSG